MLKDISFVIFFMVVEQKTIRLSGEIHNIINRLKSFGVISRYRSTIGLTKALHG